MQNDYGHDRAIEVPSRIYGVSNVVLSEDSILRQDHDFAKKFAGKLVNNGFPRRVERVRPSQDMAQAESALAELEPSVALR